MAKLPPGARRYARRFAVQALYQWQLTQLPVNDITAQFLASDQAHKMDQVYFQELFKGIIDNVAEVDEIVVPYLDRPIEQLDPVELAILRLGCFEIAKRMDVPYRVVINEALELAKLFGAVESHKYINGVLDQLTFVYRSVERAAAR